MRTLNKIIVGAFLFGSSAFAQTTIIEYPDHFYVESSGIAQPSHSSAVAGPPAAAVKVPDPPPTTSAAPITDFKVPLPTNAERRATMEAAKQHLLAERAQAAAHREGEAPEAAQLRVQLLDRRIRKIDSELLKIPTESR